MPQRLTATQRFEQHVDQAGPISLRKGAPGRCHIWTRATDRDGYGKFGADGRTHRAHRWTFEQAHGPLAPGVEVDHICRNRSCVRLDHLRAATRAENVANSSAGHNMRAKTHCPAGHPYSPDNTLIGRDGFRRCRTCRRARERARTAPVITLRTTPTPERQAA